MRIGCRSRASTRAASRIIELLVVMSLIVILATMGLAQYRNSVDLRAAKRC